MRVLPEELGLINLAGSVPSDARGYMPREEARSYLVMLTGADFGMDVEAWRQYLWDRDLIGPRYARPPV